jgi:hypothetical protein
VALVLAALAFHVTHDRSAVGRLHILVTAAAAGTWLAAADVAGFTVKGVWFTYLIVAIGGAVSWNLRGMARHQAMGDLLGHLFASAHDAAGLEGAQARFYPQEPGSKVLRGKALGVRGAHTSKSFVDAARNVESAAGLPPGSINYSRNGSDGAAADMTVSDPRAIDTSPAWPGPSAPGASVAKPLRVAMWQTGEWTGFRLVPAHHILIAGMTGAAKSTSAGWSLLAELVTRHDVKVYAADTVKGEQTLGAFRPCLATDAPGCEGGILTDPDHAAGLLAWARAQIRPRTDYLASKGVMEWQESCGIDLLVFWLEEAPDFIDHAGEAAAEEWVKSMKAARSAGIIFVYSCQRPDWSQMPTIARAQFAGRVAMGVNTSGDADLCITERQDRAGCEPEHWADREKGKAYLDGPWVTDEQVPLTARFCFWGRDSSLITEHCRAFARQATAPAPGGGPVGIFDRFRDPDPAGLADDEDLYADTRTPEDEALSVLGPDDDPVPEAASLEPSGTEWVFGEEAPPEDAPEADAEQAFDKWLAERARMGQRTFRAADLVEMRASCGRSRSWVYDQLQVRVARGQLSRGEGTWTIRDAA